MITAASLLVGHSFRRPLPLRHGGGPSLCATCEPSGELVMLCCRLRLPDDSPTTPSCVVAFLRGRLRRILVVGGRWRFVLSLLAPHARRAPELRPTICGGTAEFE